MSGYGLPKEQHLSFILQESLKSKGINIEVINGSVSGSTSSGGLNRAEWTLSQPGINLIILGLGANDMLRGIEPSETKKNLEKIVQISLKKNIDIILAGMIAPNSHGLKYKKKFDKIFPDLSKKYKLELIPFLLDGIAMNPDLNLSDGMHPNHKGVMIISKKLEKIILKKKIKNH